MTRYVTEREKKSKGLTKCAEGREREREREIEREIKCAFRK